MPPDLLSRALLSGATLFWLLCWSQDAASTWRGLRRRGGGVDEEQNPIARALFRRFGLRGGLALVFTLEALIVALHWPASCIDLGLLPAPLPAALAALSLVLGGAAHLLAARANRTGQVPRILLPILRLYQRWGRG